MDELHETLFDLAERIQDLGERTVEITGLTSEQECRDWLQVLKQGYPGIEDEIYLIQIDSIEGYVKIGQSRNVIQRVTAMQVGSPYDICLIDRIPAREGLEKELHTRFRRYRARGEWFSPAPEIFEYFKDGRQKRVREYAEKKSG